MFEMESRADMESEHIINLSLIFFINLTASNIATISDVNTVEYYGRFPYFSVCVSVVIAKLVMLFCWEPSVQINVCVLCWFLILKKYCRKICDEVFCFICVLSEVSIASVGKNHAGSRYGILLSVHGKLFAIDVLIDRSIDEVVFAFVVI